MTTLSGPMFESTEGSVFKKEGAHYNIFYIPRDKAMAELRRFFPDGKADELNFVLFSTSGVHGHYGKIEDVGVPYDEDTEEAPDDVTFVIVHPRLVCLRYGNVVPSGADDIAFLKRLRESSWGAARKIGATESP